MGEGIVGGSWVLTVPHVALLLLAVQCRADSVNGIFAEKRGGAAHASGGAVCSFERSTVDLLEVDVDGNTTEPTPDFGLTARIETVVAPPPTVDMGAWEK